MLSFVSFSNKRAVHGFVQVERSVAVNTYPRVSAETRVNRSTRCRSVDEPRRLLNVEKFVVSTTSVSPSQRPLESPSSWPMALPT